MRDRIFQGVNPRCGSRARQKLNDRHPDVLVTPPFQICAELLQQWASTPLQGARGQVLNHSGPVGVWNGAVSNLRKTQGSHAVAHRGVQRMKGYSARDA